MKLLILLLLSSSLVLAKGPGGKNKKDDDWSAEEYSGTRGEKDLVTALSSKGFTWITGSPADNEILSIGKNAQFFGFVALRYQSGRAANRGHLGRAFHQMATEEQRAILRSAVLAEKQDLKDWWETREQILSVLEEHLFVGTPFKERKEELEKLATTFGEYGAKVGIEEAKAFAKLEDTLSEKQRETLTKWREKPELTAPLAKKYQIKDKQLDRDDNKQLEDLFAKAFSWLTSERRDTEIIPIGQPAQFFGFVALRHKSGHGANRGNISSEFFKILTRSQQKLISKAVDDEMPVVESFLEHRHQFLDQLELLRENPKKYDEKKAISLAVDMSRDEVEAAVIEATCYAKIRNELSVEQLAAAQKLRGNYIVDPDQVKQLDLAARGELLSNLCYGCHGAPDSKAKTQGIAPSLVGLWDRPIASARGYQYSSSLLKLRQDSRTKEGHWTTELLDQFIANPRHAVPGTKMEFAGLIDATDREALILHLETALK